MRQSLESSLAFENLSKVLRLHFDGSSSIGGGRGLVAMLASILPPTLGRANAFLDTSQCKLNSHFSVLQAKVGS